MYRDPETFYDNIFFTIATVAIVKIHANYEKCRPLLLFINLFEKAHIL